MIAKHQLLARAREWGLLPRVVEKDYVLGWLLAGFSVHPDAAATWVFKGGTCLKKCFFETYRFSEDLDFTLTQSARYEAGALRSILLEVASWVAEHSGIQVPTEHIRVETITRRGRITFEGRIGYFGPLQDKNYPRVLLDLTQNEPLVREPESRSIFHPYPDELPTGARIACYSLVELYAEKTRALYERSRPRDLYDVAQLWDRRGEIDLVDLRDAFGGKCSAKSLPTPAAIEVARMVRDSAELQSEWGNMLGHQLPALPPIGAMLARLDEILSWLDSVTPAGEPPRLANAEGTPVAPRGGHFWGVGESIERVRFAGANRLLVEFLYRGKRRRAEPYSLRRRGTGNLLLYAWEVGATTIKAFDVSRMTMVNVTNVPFAPRFRVELTG